MFSELNNSNPFGKVADFSEIPTVKLQDCKDGDVFAVLALYYSDKGIYQPHYTAIITDCIDVLGKEDVPLYVMSLPSYANEQCAKIMSNMDMIEAVKGGDCGIKCRKYHSKKQNKDYIGIEWLDLTANVQGEKVT